MTELATTALIVETLQGQQENIAGLAEALAKTDDLISELQHRIEALETEVTPPLVHADRLRERLGQARRA